MSGSQAFETVCIREIWVYTISVGYGNLLQNSSYYQDTKRFQWSPLYFHSGILTLFYNRD